MTDERNEEQQGAAQSPPNEEHTNSTGASNAYGSAQANGTSYSTGAGSAHGPGATPPPYGMPPYTHQPEKTRRVGTITMGLALIFAGICALLGLLLPGFPLTTILKFTPLIFVILGLEIIINAAVYKGQKLKYDILSGFVCFLLIAGGVGAATLPAILDNWGPRRNEMERSMERSIETLYAERLTSASPIQSLNANVYLNRTELNYKSGATYEDLLGSDFTELNITLNGAYPDAAGFAKDCRTVLDQMVSLPLTPDHVNFYSYGSGAELDRFELTIDSPFTWKQDAASLARLVEHSDSERRQLEQERDQLYSQLESEREEMNSNRESQQESASSYFEEEQARLQDERERLYSELEDERQRLYSELEQERSSISQAA